MGLTLALKAHGKGDLDEASAQYKRALDQGVEDPRLFGNFGALLKSEGKLTEAENVYLRGLELFPEETTILRNYSNLVRDKRPIYSLELYFKILSCLSTDPAFVRGEKAKINLFVDSFLDIIDILINHNLCSWSVSFIKKYLHLVNDISPVVLKHLLVLLASDDTSMKVDEKTLKAIEKLSYELVEFSPLDKAVSLDFALANYYLEKETL